MLVSYWQSDAHIRAWRAVAEHLVAQRRGKDEWFDGYEIRVAKVERAYGGRKS